MRRGLLPLWVVGDYYVYQFSTPHLQSSKFRISRVKYYLCFSDRLVEASEVFIMLILRRLTSGSPYDSKSLRDSDCFTLLTVEGNTEKLTCLP